MELYKALIDRLTSQHLIIRELTSNVTEEQFDNKPSPGTWSIHDNIAHITMYHLVFYRRLQMIIENEGLKFERYNPDEDMDFKNWQKMSTDDLLNKLNENRKLLVDFIFSLKENQLSRSATHQKFGKMNVVEWIEFFLLHEAHHIYTIFKLIRS